MTSAAIASPGLHYELLRIENHYQFYRRDGSWHYEPVKVTKRIAGGSVDATTDKPGHIALPVNFGRYKLNVSDASGVTTSVGFFAGSSSGHMPVSGEAVLPPPRSRSSARPSRHASATRDTRRMQSVKPILP